MKSKTRFIWLTVFVLLYSALAVNSVSAHALLLRSNPASNAVLEKSPVQVELFFSEPLESQLSSIKVVDSNNQRVDVGDVRVDPADATRMTVSVRSLSDGVYSVTWTAVSSIDGHQTVGSFPFAVGNANAAAVSSIQQSTTTSLPFSALFSKFLFLCALALMVGQRMFIWLVWNPVLHSDKSNVDQPDLWSGFYRIGLIGLFVAIGIGILSQAGQTTGAELTVPWNPETGRILTETRLGVIWLFRLALVLLAIWLAGRKESRWRDWLALVLNLVLLFTVTLTSHAATEAQPLLPMLADWIHLIGMTFWLGGLVFLFTGLRQLQQVEEGLRTKLTALLASRFSVNAIIFVSLIGLTGFYAAYLRVGTLPALLATIYGHVLLIKQVFVGGLLVIAAINLLIIAPRLNRDRRAGVADPGLVAHFGRMLVFELMFAGLLLASVSLLTYLPPAKIVPLNSALTKTSKADDLRMKITIAPGHVGPNTFTLKVISADGTPLASAKEVLLQFTPLQGNIPPSRLELIADGDGNFSAKGANLSLPSEWQVQAVVRREGKFDTFANFNFKLQKPGAAGQDTSATRQAGGLLLLSGIACGLLMFSPVGNPKWRIGLGIVPTLLVAGMGVYLLTRPVVTASMEQANPIPPTGQSIAAGQTLYTAHCVPCHGVSGKGDGPLGVTLNPKPADLTLHAIPGVHTDAQLYEWITNGFPGSAMPAWKSQLSDTDRWNLVNFIRTLAPK